MTGHSLPRALSLADRSQVLVRLFLIHMLLCGLAGGATCCEAVAAEPPTAKNAKESVEAVERALKAVQPDPEEASQSPWVEVHGRLLRPDGEPLQASSASLLSFSDYGRGNMHLFINDEGRFRVRVRRNASFHILTRRSDLLAAHVYGPYQADEDPTDLEAITTQPGFTGKIRFVDPEGKPLAGVRLIGATSWLGSGSRSMGMGIGLPKPARSGTDGILQYARVSEQPLTLETWKPGYQFAVREVTFQPDQVIEWTLMPARPTIGRIVDGKTGKPVADAEVWLASRQGYHSHSYDPRATRDRYADEASTPSPTQRLATTGPEGRFTVSHWRDDAVYSVMILSDEHRPKLINEMKCGQDVGDVRLEPPLYLAGKINGDLAAMQQGDQRVLRYRNDLDFGTRSHSSFFTTPVGEDGRFRIRQLVADNVQLFLPDGRVDVRVSESIDDWTFDLDKPEPIAALEWQDVLVHLQASAGQPLKGEVRVSWSLAPQENAAFQGKRHEMFSVTETPFRWSVPNGATLWISDVSLVGSRLRDRKLGTVSPSTSAVEFQAVVDPAGAVTGRLLNPEGSPIRDFRLHVDVWTNGGRQRLPIATAAVHHPEGRFAVDGLPLDPSHEVRLFALVEDTRRIALSEPFHVSADAPVAEIDMRTNDAAEVKGRLLNADGSPLADRAISVSYQATRITRPLGAGLRTDTEGRFTTQLSQALPGAYRLEVRPQQDHAGKTIVLHSGSLGDVTDVGDLKLREGVTMRGTIIGVDGSAKAEARVILMPVDRETAQFRGYLNASTDAEGNFEIDGVEPVRQRVNVVGEDILEVYGAFEIVEDKADNKFWTVMPHPSNPATTIIVGKKE